MDYDASANNFTWHQGLQNVWLLYKHEICLQLHAIFGVKYELLSCNMAHCCDSSVSKLHVPCVTVDHAQHVQSVYPWESVSEVGTIKGHEKIKWKSLWLDADNLRNLTPSDATWFAMRMHQPVLSGTAETCTWANARQHDTTLAFCLCWCSSLRAVSSCFLAAL